MDLIRNTFALNINDITYLDMSTFPKRFHTVSTRREILIQVHFIARADCERKANNNCYQTSA